MTPPLPTNEEVAWKALIWECHALIVREEILGRRKALQRLRQAIITVEEEMTE